MRISAIVLAAGAGRRFRSRKDKYSGIPKAIYPLKARPMFSYSLETLSRCREIREIILTVPAPLEVVIRKKYVGKPAFPKVKQVIVGGKVRSDSCLRAFKRVSKAATHVLIHDAARPLLSSEALKKLIRAARKSDGAILGKRVIPTIKSVDERMNICSTIPREWLWEAETPQIFKRKLLKKAFDLYIANPAPVSDDAGLCEQLGAKIKMVENRTPNIKITTLADHRLAETFLSNGETHRFGTGFDIHRLVPNRKLKLGGVKISSKMGALGHSDGDALLHAVTDALLGAAGLGDIGDWFPDTEKKHSGASSKKFLLNALASVREKGFTPVNVDTTIHLERPKLGKFKEKIRLHLARLLSLEKSRVNVKAKTREGLGVIGGGKAVACDAIVSLGHSHG